MAAITVTWDASTPAGTEAINNGDNRIVELKEGLVQRFRNGGHRMQTSGATTDAKDGRHCCDESNDAGSAESEGEFTIYASDGATALVVFRDTTATPASEVSFGANKILTTGNITAATGTFSGAITTAALTATGHIKPTTDALYNLGDATHRFADAWFSGTVTFDGAIVHNALETFNSGIQIAGDGTGSKFLDIATAQYCSNVVTSVATGSYAVAATWRIILANLTADATVVLPPAASSSGRELWFKVASSTSSVHSLTIDPNATEEIDGGTTSLIIHPNSYTGYPHVQGVHLICDGTAWHTITRYLRNQA